MSEHETTSVLCFFTSSGVRYEILGTSGSQGLYMFPSGSSGSTPDLFEFLVKSLGPSMSISSSSDSQDSIKPLVIIIVLQLVIDTDMEYMICELQIKIKKFSALLVFYGTSSLVT